MEHVIKAEVHLFYTRDSDSTDFDEGRVERWSIGPSLQTLFKEGPAACLNEGMIKALEPSHPQEITIQLPSRERADGSEQEGDTDAREERLYIVPDDRSLFRWIHVPANNML